MNGICCPTSAADGGEPRPLDAAPGGPPAPTFGSARTWLVGFSIFFALLAAWSLSTPKFAAPDEPAHAARAGSLVRGQLLGRPLSSNPADPRVAVGLPLSLVPTNIGCFIFQSSQPASCARVTSPLPDLRTVSTYTGRYPPLYYLAVGLPSLWASSGRVLWWMRLGGDAVNAVLLTAAFIIAGRSMRSVWSLVGVAAATTPMVLFLGSVVNPSGLEICSAITLWSALLALTRSPGGDRSRTVVMWATVSAVVLDSTRGLSPVLMALSVLAAFAAASPARLRRLLGRRQVRVGGVVVAGLGAVAVGWVLWAGTLRLMQVSIVPASMSTAHLVRVVLGQNIQFDEFVGRFGWLDTRSPVWVVYLWAAALCGLVVALVHRRAWRVLTVVGVLAAASILIPTVEGVVQARTIGLFSQARYIMPLAVGLPILAGTALRFGRPISGRNGQLLLAALAAAQLAAFWAALNRYRFGSPPQLPLRYGPWNPPLPAQVLLTVMVIALLALQLWCATLVREPGSTPPADRHP